MIGVIKITIIPNLKKCKKCGKMYDYNPDVGTMFVKKNWCSECINSELEKAKHFLNNKRGSEK